MIEQLRQKILEQINLLVDDPISHSLKLSGEDNIYRVRVGDYRIIFKLVKSIVEIQYVRHRKKSYRNY